MAPRQRKPRTSRMDAAIDAMVPFGFTKEVVKDKMRRLLKEYGGDDGYGFIEVDAYRVLLEGLLDDQEKGMPKGNQQQVPLTVPETSKNEMIDANKVKENHAVVTTAGFTDIPVCSSTPLTIPPPPPPPPVVTAMDADLPLPPPATDAALALPEIAQPHRRKPCYGWISDIDEEWHFITLPSSLKQPISPPETPPPQPAQPHLSGGRMKRPKRRSRWDLMPEDM